MRGGSLVSLPSLLAALIVAQAIPACSPGPAARASAAVASKPPAASGLTGGAKIVTRNVEASDYAGTEVCRSCHAEVVQAFTASPMHRMTRMIATATVNAPFGGETLTVGDDAATLETRDAARFVRLDRRGSGQGSTTLFRVTRVLGGHHREDFVGVAVPAYDATPGGEELVLPVSYLIEPRRLRYKGYSVMVHERDRLQAGPVWDETCIFCHNTVPLLSTLLGALEGPSAPHYQGEVVDGLLPRDRAFSYVVTDAAGLESAVLRETRRLGGDAVHGGPSAVLLGAIQTTRHRFSGDKLLEVGIGCESCHGGSREHTVDPSVRPSLLPRAPYLSVRDAHGSEPRAAETHVCARCHQVLFSRYPWTWEGGRRNGMPGGSHISSGEARDLMLGGCSGALRCTACHDPHAPTAAARGSASAVAAGNEVCLGCHTALRARPAWRAHAHHDPDGAGGACIACHMPRKNMGLDGRLGPYHRIGSPTEPARVLNDRPIECALCHADRSVSDLTRTMETWWKRRYDRDALRASYGDLDANALRATLARGKPHEKAVALAVLGDHRDRAAAPLFFAELEDEYPLVRDYAVDALRATLGEACDLHLEQGRAIREEGVRRCQQAAGLQGLAVPREVRTRGLVPGEELQGD